MGTGDRRASGGVVRAVIVISGVAICAPLSGSSHSQKQMMHLEIPILQTMARFTSLFALRLHGRP